METFSLLKYTVLCSSHRHLKNVYTNFVLHVYFMTCALPGKQKKHFIYFQTLLFQQKLSVVEKKNICISVKR